MTLSDLAVLVTLTTDTGKILAKLHQVNHANEMKFISGIKIAHLCLKHRQGKNHKTRIIAFVGSPIEADEKEGTGSHLVTIPPGPYLSDALVSSPIVQGEDGSGAGITSTGGGGFEFGVDPNDDPELALALRVSMEEQRARQQAESGGGAGGEE